MDQSSFRSQADRIASRRERIEAVRISKSKVEGEREVEKPSELASFVQLRESHIQMQKSLKHIEETKVRHGYFF